MTVWNWREEFARASLRLAVLSALSHGDAHGYHLLNLLKERGLGHIKGGTLYPILVRMEEEGLLSHQWDTETPGPARKILHLTDDGREQLKLARQAWKDISPSLDMLVQVAPSTPDSPTQASAKPNE